MHNRIPGRIELAEIEEQRKHPRVRVTQLLEFLTIILRISQSQVDLIHKKFDLQTSFVALAGQYPVIVQEIIIGGDVMVDHDLFIRNPEKHLGNGRADGKMEDDNIVWRAKCFIFPEIMDVFGHPRFIKTDKDLRIVPFFAKHTLDLEQLI